MLRTAMIAIFWIICGVANAQKAPRVYFVNGPEDPVVIGSKAKSGNGLVMRDPNLGSPDAITKTPQKGAHGPLKMAQIQKRPAKKASVLAFKAVKIGATVRMPRVDFGRVALPLGIRNELPSTDFISKSIDEMP